MTDRRRRGIIATLVTFIALWLIVLVTNLSVITRDALVVWLLLAAATAAVTTAVIILILRANVRVQQDQRLLWLYALETATIGLVFGGMQAGLTAAANLPLAYGAPLTMATSALTFCVGGILGGQLYAASQESRRRREALIEEGVAVELARQGASEVAREMHRALNSSIATSLESARRDLESRIEEQQRELAREQWPAIARELRLTADATVRPLSRQLWNQATGSDARPKVRDILRNVVTTQPFQPVALVLIYLVSSFAQAFSRLGFTGGVASLALGCLLIVGILGAANALMRRWPARHVAIFVGALFVLECTQIRMFAIYDRWGDVPYTVGEFVVAIFAGIVFIVGTSAYGSLRSHREDVERTFAADVDQELIISIATSRRLAQLARESARVLHGSVQTRLIACAVAIERADEELDAAGFLIALREAQQALGDPQLLAPPTDRDMAAEVQAKIDLWSGLCEVTLDVDPRLGDVTGPVARNAGRVVEEALGNAVRHGDARIVRVRLVATAAGVRVEVDDDGRGEHKGAPGLGSAMLDAVTASWSLQPSPTGCLLTAEIALPSGRA